MLPSSTSLNRHVLAILDKCNDLHHLKQLQSHLISLGHGNTHFYAFKLIRICTTRICNLRYARFLFDKFYSPNIYLYTAIIAAYTAVPDHESAVLLYRDMIRENQSKPNHFMFSIIMKSWPEVVRSYGVELVQAQIGKSGFGGYPVVQTAILDAYSRYGDDVHPARKVFDEMSERNVVSWTAMISGYTRAGKMENAILLFEEMSEEIRDTPFWNCIIAGCVQNGLFSEAIEFFRKMVVEEGNRPNQGTIVCALSALGHSGMLQIGKCIHGYIYRNGLSLCLFVVNGLIDMYGKCGSFEKSRIVFDKSPEINLATWNSLINCYALHGRSHDAIRFFEDMLQHDDGLKPDEVTFVGLLNACTHGGLVSEGRHFYDMMINDYGIKPQIEHYGCLIDLLGRSGQFEEAMEVVQGMRVPPDEAVWGALLNGCKIHRRTDLAEFAVKQLLEINPDNGGYSAMLANLYGELGKWDEAQKAMTYFEHGNADMSLYQVSTPGPRRPRILLASSGSVAAIKFANLCHCFSEWAEVKAVATQASLHFVDKVAIPKDVVLYTDEDEWSTWKNIGDNVLHIEMRKWADIMVIAPLSANTLAKIAGGLCDNLLTCIVRAWDYSKPMFIAPAMNTLMWDNPFTERHLMVLDDLGMSLIPPVKKRLACGDYGNGAMAEPSLIYSTVRLFYETRQQSSAGVVIDDAVGIGHHG